MSTPARKETVLLIDDEMSVLKMVGRRLMSQGFTVLTADSGEAGLRIAEETPPDVVLLDIMMPRMKGRDVCARLKGNPKTKHVPVIFLTALELADHVRAGMAAGADDYLVKPFESEELKRRIKVVLARAASRTNGRAS
jgi:DNA-binding response OmpR family regulator